MGKIAVCVVNYNNGERTIRCIQSILNQSFSDYSIIIVDNGSADGSVSLIESFCISKGLTYELKTEGECPNPLSDGLPGLLLIKSGRNGGYAFGVNIAIRFVHEHDAFKNILIINNDVHLTADFIETMINKFDQYQKMLNTTSIAIGASEISLTGKFRHNGFHYLNLLSGLVFSFPLFPSIKYIVGSAIFIDSKAPLMDESFFLYYEDVHYRQILKRNKYRILNCRNAKYFHELGGSTKKDPEMYEIIYTSLKHFYKLNYPYLLFFVLFIRFMLNLLMGRWKIAKYILGY